MCKSSRDSKDFYFFFFFFCPSPFHSVNSVLLILAAFFFLPPKFCCPKILDVLDLKLSDSWHFLFYQKHKKKDTEMHSDAALVQVSL